MSGPYPSVLMGIPDGREGVRETLRVMREFIQRGKVNPTIRALAVDLTNHLPQKDFTGEVKALHEFVRDRIRYVRDTDGVDTLHFAQTVLEQGAGDCDDKVILLASLLESIGHPTRSVAIALRPGLFSHVYLETRPRGMARWIPLETTEPVPMGWEPRGVSERMILSNA